MFPLGTRQPQLFYSQVIKSLKTCSIYFLVFPLPFECIFLNRITMILNRDAFSLEPGKCNTGICDQSHVLSALFCFCTAGYIITVSPQQTNRSPQTTELKPLSFPNFQKKNLSWESPCSEALTKNLKHLQPPPSLNCPVAKKQTRTCY